MKEILIDLYKLRNLYSGLGQFSMNFAAELMRQVPENTGVTFLVPHDFRGRIDAKAGQLRADYQKRYLPAITRSYDIWHSLNQFPSHFPNRRTIQILTVHDLNFLVEKSPQKCRKYLTRLQGNVDRADYITSISQSTRKVLEDNIDLKGKKVRVIYNGVSVGNGLNGSKPEYVKRRNFFFSIGVFSRKKNFHVLLPMMKYFRDRQLIIAGDNNSSYGEYIASQIERYRLKESVVTPGIISEAEKSWLYSNCEAFLFPSVAEGFGLPVVEAMKSGSPLFLNKIDSLYEVAGEDAYYFPSFDEKDMYSLINQRLSFPGSGGYERLSNAQRHASAFTWERCIEEYLSLYREVLG